ncbi:hypothetical protein [Allomeiothermus silvanus]|uniref:hypothetical protein n=1 Tax=Allomeiothermus silvanus TaxID=52022 RepID=UPI00145EC3DE|nr:hypothetical protein [Allomeiothermus silvanus]
MIDHVAKLFQDCQQGGLALLNSDVCRISSLRVRDVTGKFITIQQPLHYRYSR